MKSNNECYRLGLGPSLIRALAYQEASRKIAQRLPRYHGQTEKDRVFHKAKAEAKRLTKRARNVLVQFKNFDLSAELEAQAALIMKPFLEYA